MNSSTAPSEYMLLFRGPDWDRDITADETRQMLDRAMAWFEAVQRQGKVKATQALDRVGRVVSGKGGHSVTDGPFAESKEAIGGYLLLQVADIEEAVAIAQTCPTLEYGISVEIRPALHECPIAKRLREQQVEVAA